MGASETKAVPALRLALLGSLFTAAWLGAPGDLGEPARLAVLGLPLACVAGLGSAWSP